LRHFIATDGDNGVEQSHIATFDKYNKLGVTEYALFSGLSPTMEPKIWNTGQLPIHCIY
jgi:hypothetical protein